MTSEYSTLPELDKRAINVTLEVRRSTTGLEVLSNRHQDSTLTPPVKQKLTRRFWLWLLFISLGVLVAAAIAGSVSGVLLNRKASEATINTSKQEEDFTTSVTTSASSSTSSSTLSPSLSQSTADRRTSQTASSSTSTKSSVVPTRTPSPSEAPTLPIRIGNAEGAGFKSTISFADDNTTAAVCGYTVILEIDGGNPCGKVFLLQDGFEYVWNGCGGDTWATWRNPAGSDAKFKVLGDCVGDFQTWKCGNTTVMTQWRCP